MDTVKIGVNLLYLRPGGVGGSETYVRAVLEAMGHFPGIQLEVFGNQETVDSFGNTGGMGFHVVHGQSFGQLTRLWHENVTLARHLEGLEVLWSPSNFIAPCLPSRIPQAATIYDLQHRWFPRNFSRLQNTVREILFRLTFSKASAWFAISDFSRRDVLKRYGASPKKAHSVLLGADLPGETPAEKEKATLKKYNLQKPYFIFPATMAPHKGHAFLMEALAKANQRHPGKVPQLVLTGRKTGLWPGIESQIQELGPGQSVTHLGYLPQEDTLALVGGAQALLFPSRFEGFGLPVLEAMSLGTPVLASRNTAILEVAGKGARLLPTYDADSWADAIVQISQDEGLRTKLVKRGHENCKRFSWEKCARETLAILLKCTHRGSNRIANPAVLGQIPA